VAEERLRVLRSDGSDGLRDRRFQLIENAGLHSSQELFQLGPGLLDGIEVGRVGRQVQQLRAAAFQQPAHSFDLVRAQIVEDNDVARLQPWSEHLFHKSQKTSPSVGDSMVILASMPSQLSAASTVKVRPWPAGTASDTRSGRGAQP
jgi:hypothetical protein